MTPHKGWRPFRKWTLAAAFGGWAAFVLFHYFAQFGDYFSAVWERMPW